MSAALVSVIIPAYNAGATLPETLDSVLAQTHRALEILIVDDGSLDATAEIAERYARLDDRVMLVRQPNLGVAAARNLGISKSAGRFIAPLDADDLWHPEKVERQVVCFESQPADTGLVYSWFRTIDSQSFVVAPAAKPTIEGWVLHRHLDFNFIGNGSMPLIRAEALRGLRFETRLAAAGAGGCEDYLLQLQLAQRYRFACVPGYLTGYRKQAGGMSANMERMLRSYIMMYDLLQPSLPATAQRIARRKVAEYSVELVRNQVRRGRIIEAARALVRALRTNPSSVPPKMFEQALLTGRHFGARERSMQPVVTNHRFLDPPAHYTEVPRRRSLARERLLARLEALDREYGRSRQEL